MLEIIRLFPPPTKCFIDGTMCGIFLYLMHFSVLFRVLAENPQGTEVLFQVLVLHHLELFNRSQSLFLSAFPQKTNKNHETSGPVWGSFGPVDWTVNFHFRIVLCCCWKFHVCWFCVHQFYINIARGFVYFGKKWLECINKNVWETIIQSTMFCTVCHR